MNRKLLWSPGFVRAARRYARRHARGREMIRAALLSLEQDAFDAKLRTHKLKGELAGSWSCSAGYDLRIAFELVQFGQGEAIPLLSVGTHDEVY